MESTSVVQSTADGFAEVGTITHQGRDFANGGAFRTKDRMFAYVRVHRCRDSCNCLTLRADVTDWEGNKLGTAHLGLSYRVPAFGGWFSERQSMDVTLTDGSKWYGTYYKSSGDYCRLRKRKHQS